MSLYKMLFVIFFLFLIDNDIILILLLLLISVISIDVYKDSKRNTLSLFILLLISSIFQCPINSKLVLILLAVVYMYILILNDVYYYMHKISHTIWINDDN